MPLSIFQDKTAHPIAIPAPTAHRPPSGLIVYVGSFTKNLDSVLFENFAYESYLTLKDDFHRISLTLIPSILLTEQISAKVSIDGVQIEPSSIKHSNFARESI